MNTITSIGTNHKENLPTQSQSTEINYEKIKEPSENNLCLEIILAFCFHLILKRCKRIKFGIDFSFRISDKNKKP